MDALLQCVEALGCLAEMVKRWLQAPPEQRLVMKAEVMAVAREYPQDTP